MKCRGTESRPILTPVRTRRRRAEDRSDDPAGKDPSNATNGHNQTLGDKEGPIACERETIGRPYLGGRCGAAVARATACAVARDCRDGSVRCGDAAHSAASQFRHDHIAARREDDGNRLVQGCALCGPTVARRGRDFRNAGDGEDCAIRGHLSNHAVLEVSPYNRTVGANRNTASRGAE